MARVSIRVLGQMRVEIDGANVELPKSRKTRALLAYMISARKPVRREELCDLIWPLPADPRAALRWSLTKLRNLIEVGDDPIFISSADTLRLNDQAISLDIAVLEGAYGSNFGESTTTELAEMVENLCSPFGESIEMPDNQDFQLWFRSERKRIAGMQIALCEKLLGCREVEMNLRIQTVRRMIELAPENHAFRMKLNSLIEGKVESLDITAEATARPNAQETRLVQEIRFCKTGNGTRIAWAKCGSGPAIVKAANWLNHLEFDWESPIWKHFFHYLARNNSFIRYDERGTGLSDWDVGEITPEACLRDLEAVVEASGEKQIVLLGVSQGAAFSVAFAARHPELVAGMILIGGFVTGWRNRNISAEKLAELEGLNSAVFSGWGKDNPVFRQIFTSIYVPSADREQIDWFNEMQRKSASPQNATRIRNMSGDIKYADLLGEVQAPTLVLHAEGDEVVPIRWGKEIAAGIEGARFVSLPSNNHLVLEQEEAWPVMKREIDEFLNELGLSDQLKAE